MAKNIKKRAWEIVAYPESVPENWIGILQKTGLQCAISPLHDKDVNPGGEQKKPHWHIIAVWSGPTTDSVAKGVARSIGTELVRAVESVKGLYRYLTHKDNPEKYQYDEKDIRHLSGFNIANYCELTMLEMAEIKRRLRALIRELDIRDYANLMDYLDANGMTLEATVADTNTIFFAEYLRSRRTGVAFSKINIDPETGEVTPSAKDV
jgi:hypothetical protein